MRMKQHNCQTFVLLLTPHLPSRNKEDNSPQLIHHSHQHEEGVLTDSLLKCVWEVAKLLICGCKLKNQLSVVRPASVQLTAALRNIRIATILSSLKLVFSFQEIRDTDIALINRALSSHRLQVAGV